jgi:DnaK suppressor protein
VIFNHIYGQTKCDVRKRLNTLSITFNRCNESRPTHRIISSNRRLQFSMVKTVKAADTQKATSPIKAAKAATATKAEASAAAVPKAPKVAKAQPHVPTVVLTRPEPIERPKSTRILTEAEVIKISKTDYMNADQLEFFRQILLKLQSELYENAGATTEHLRELSLAPDPADRATQEEEHALELRTRDRERKLLKKVQGALMRIENDDYGYCEETGDPIGIQRLIARPTATLTIEAQERRELKQKMYGE